MEDIKYYPVVDISGDGKFRCAMFPTDNEAKAKEHHKAYLEEISRNRFRLHAEKPFQADVRIGCPRCTKEMECIYRSRNSSHCSVYKCNSCD